jgi:hypothetical protein
MITRVNNINSKSKKSRMLCVVCKVCNIYRPAVFMHTDKCLGCMQIATLNATQNKLIRLYNSSAGSEKCGHTCEKCGNNTIRNGITPYRKHYPHINKNYCCECVLKLACDESIFNAGIKMKN